VARDGSGSAGSTSAGAAGAAGGREWPPAAARKGRTGLTRVAGAIYCRRVVPAVREAALRKTTLIVAALAALAALAVPALIGVPSSPWR
jgi:hypothetical protein